MEQFPSQQPQEELSENQEKSGIGESIKKLGRKTVVAAGMFIAGSGAVQAQQHMSEGRSSNARHSIEAATPLATPEQIKVAHDYYEAERQWLISIVKSPEYKKRLESEGLDQALLEQRLRSILNTPVVIKRALRPYVAGDDAHPIVSQYLSKEDKHGRRIELPAVGYDNMDNFGISIHEQTHNSTDADREMSQYAVDLYEKAFVESNEEHEIRDSLLTLPGIVVDKKTDTLTVSAEASATTRQAFREYMSSYDYFSDPTELDARKKVLEYEMEVMGIKKYGEQFTKYDLQELMKNYDHLSRNSQEFLDHIDQGYFITIMNTIADMQTPTEVHWNDVA